MLATGVTFAVLTMVIAFNSGVVVQIACQQSLYSCVCAAAYATIQLNACSSQRHLRPAADTAANQNVCLQRGQNTCQSTMTLAVGIHNLGRNNFAVLHIINLKLLSMSEMLKNLAVFIGYCNSHDIFSLFLVLFI